MLLIRDSNVDVIIQAGVDCGVGCGVSSIESLVGICVWLEKMSVDMEMTVCKSFFYSLFCWFFGIPSQYILKKIWRLVSIIFFGCGRGKRLWLRRMQFVAIPAIAWFPGHESVAWYPLFTNTLDNCENIQNRVSKINVSVNGLSHMARSSMEIVYDYSKWKNQNLNFLLLKWLSNQSSIVKEPVILHPL